MAKNKFIILISVFAFTLTACMSTQKTKPDFEDYVPSSFWGLVGESYPVDVKKVCQNKDPIEVRKGKSGEDWLLSLFTLGIYWPRTVQVWCPETGAHTVYR